ncbi:hypothetical protein [Arthrobacter sp. 7Tela_A1]|uniref:hypothetical protein n=1 Tax=Arthrobacter sp. 7Tela_A1 TaxID=3093745 RepID=UPI003BB7064A
MGTQPNDPMYNYNRGYGGPPQSNQGRGMALAGLILGIIALFLFWVPLVNFLGLVLAVVGLGLAIAALAVAVRERSSAKGLSIAALIVSAIAFLLCLFVSFLWAALFDSIDDATITPSPQPETTITRSVSPTTGTGATSSSPPATGGTTSAPAPPTTGTSTPTSSD